MYRYPWQGPDPWWVSGLNKIIYGFVGIVIASDIVRWLWEWITGWFTR